MQLKIPAGCSQATKEAYYYTLREHAHRAISGLLEEFNCLESTWTNLTPIEQVLLFALKLFYVDSCRTSTEYLIKTQIKIEKYRVDFVVICVDCENEIAQQIIVEADSQQFHERTEKERRYEKERDRFLAEKGYTVLHFTGKEILEDAESCVTEIHKILIKQPWGKEYAC